MVVVMVMLMVVVIEGWFNFGMRKGINFNFTFSQIVDYHGFQYFTFTGSLFK